MGGRKVLLLLLQEARVDVAWQRPFHDKCGHDGCSEPALAAQ